MKPTSLITSYTSKNSLLHRLHIASKLFLLLAYTVIIFVSPTPLTVLSLCLLFTIVTLLLQLPLRNRTIIGITTLLLLVSVAVPSGSTIGVRLILAFGKIVCLIMILALFSMSTKLNETFQLVKPSSSASMSGLQSIGYIVNTTLAVLPGIQYDLQRTIDAETIRRGRKVRFYSFGAWVTILTVVLVRSLTRANCLAETVIDRGYLPSKGLTPLEERSLKWQDLFLTIFSILPGLVILRLTL